MAIKNKPEDPPKKRFILPIDASDRFKLHSIYMPFLKGGGIFFSTKKEFDLGDDVNLLINLAEEPEKIMVEGKVAWMTPKHSEGGLSTGIGVQMLGDSAEMVRSKIENVLAGQLTAEPYTHTM